MTSSTRVDYVYVTGYMITMVRKNMYNGRVKFFKHMVIGGIYISHKLSILMVDYGSGQRWTYSNRRFSHGEPGWHGLLAGMSDNSLYTNGNKLVRAIQLIRPTIVGGLTIPSQ